MLKKIFILLCFIFVVKTTQAQSITVLDSTYAVYNYSATPIDQLYDYSYTQVIYRKNDIQGNGTITSLNYYFLGNSLSNSDSVLVYLGNTDWDEFDYRIGRDLVPIARMDSVFLGRLSYTTLPGIVTINLATPFIYKSDSNLVVALCEMKPGNNVVTNGLWFKGYDGVNTGLGLITCKISYVDLNPMRPAYVEQHLNQYLGGSGGIAKITFVGLTPFPCQSPKRIKFSNIEHNKAKVMWSPPLSTTPTAYDIYYSPNRSKPYKKTQPLGSVNAPDTQIVINSLLSDTMYYVWVRSRCGSADTSVWTYMDSFHTICAPLPIPTVVEPFPAPAASFEWLPHCWTLAYGELKLASQLEYVTDPFVSFQPWESGKWRNVSGSTNFAAKTYFVGAVVDSNVAWLISPSYDLGTSGNKNLEFDLALTKNSNQQQGTLDADDKFAVIISTDNGATWSSANVLQQWVSPQTIAAAGQHVSIPLNSYTGVVRLAFYVQSKIFTSPAISLFVDNVVITGVMPVTLLAFTGTKVGTNNLLQWLTATEQNNRGFELQRSINSIEFSTIGYVPSKARNGNSTAELSYNYKDNNPLSGGNYYRLKQIDFDGKITYSKVVKVNLGDALHNSFTVVPNPVVGDLVLNIYSKKSQESHFSITTQEGHELYSSGLLLSKGSTSHKPMVLLDKGVYFVTLRFGDGVVTKKVVKM